MKLKTLITMLLAATASTGGFCQVKSQSPTLNNLTQGQVLNGFSVKALYLNGEDKPMGARLVQTKTGFTLDLLQIESVPQAFIWVGTHPVSEKGEPHTQEHLLITKGNKGRALTTRESMSISESNAFTEQLHTVYNFNTGAGPEVFYSMFDKYLDALLYPDYTDEEVRREVMNWGVNQNDDKTLKIEEKGTVYNEMSSSMAKPAYLLYDEQKKLVYGRNHPLAYNAGGSPEGIRAMTAQDIANYHRANYFLGNMGAIVAVPTQMKLSSVLQRINSILLNLDKPSKVKRVAKNTLSAPHGAPVGEIKVVKVPQEDVNQPGTMVIAYPADLKLSVLDNMALSFFMENVAGDATTNLYKLLVDSKTHIPGFSAQNVYYGVSNDQGNPVSITIDGVKPEYLTREKAVEIRKLVVDELKKIAAYPDNSTELLEFNKRYAISIISNQKYYNKFVSTPPQFGARNTGDAWFSTLDFLAQEPGFKRSVTFKPQLDALRKQLATGKNIWRDLLNKHGLLTKQPYVMMSQADATMGKQAETNRLARVKAETERLKKKYGTTNDQEAIAKYQQAYDKNTLELEKLQEGVHIGFVDNPPLTLDGSLNYQKGTLASNVPVVQSVFNNMTGATAAIALNLNSVSAEQLKYLSLFPQLLTGTGVLRNGQAISYPQMIQEIQKQILSLNSYYSTNTTTGRAELVVKGAGSNLAESTKAVEWMNEVLQHPNWTIDNLPRMRDVITQQWNNIRRMMQYPEEYWVSGAAEAYRAQDQPLMLNINSFMTSTFNIFRLKWMLKDGDHKALTSFISNLSKEKGSRAELAELLGKISTAKLTSGTDLANAYNNLNDAGKKLAAEAASDIAQLLTDVPDNSLQDDFTMLCKTINAGLAQGPEKTLADLNKLLAQLLAKDNARIFIIGSERTNKQVSAALEQSISNLNNMATRKHQFSKDKLVDARLQERLNINARPVYVGLINPNSATGVFINSAPLTSYRDTSTESLLQFLAAALHGGGGKESVYLKSLNAGLAYSNGVGASAGSGRFRYYAERTPELPQTLSYVISEIKKTPQDPAVLDYLIAQSIGFVRSSSTYESRGESMANDIADGTTDDVVKNFRQAVLKLRSMPNLTNEIYKRKDVVYEKILPGYGKPGKDQAGAMYFVIGPEKQMIAYEGYLKKVDGTDTQLYRLYPRDFWMTK